MLDLIILGNGMAGMTAALYAERANLNFQLFGMDEFDFGQINEAILVENYPSSEKLTGLDLATKLHDQLGNDIWHYKFESRMVTKIVKNVDCTFTVYDEANGGPTIDDGVSAKTIIYALGANHRKLPAEIDPSIPIHYCALCDGPLYKDKTVAVIGGGDVAFTQAEYLSKICKEVNIIMCDRNVTAAPSTFERVQAIDNVYIIYDYPIDQIFTLPDEHKFNYGLKPNFCDKMSNCCKLVDGIFVAVGMIPNTAPLDDSSLNYVLNEQDYIIANENGITSCPGFFAAGDVRTKKVRQSVTAAADGANAVQSVIEYLKESSN